MEARGINRKAMITRNKPSNWWVTCADGMFPKQSDEDLVSRTAWSVDNGNPDSFTPVLSGQASKKQRLNVPQLLGPTPCRA